MEFGSSLWSLGHPMEVGSSLSFTDAQTEPRAGTPAQLWLPPAGQGGGHRRRVAQGPSHPPSEQACHAAAGRGSPGPRNSGTRDLCLPHRSAPTPTAPDGDRTRCGARSRGGARKPGVRPPAGRRAWAGKRLGAARAGRDTTRAATPHLSPAAFGGAPPGAGEEELPKAGRAPPPAGRRRWMQVREKAPPLGSHYPRSVTHQTLPAWG